ncbi:MAG: xanthine dehydrogenase family protein molybdopterin-binding subunit, partial [Alphaproteobacteria bacterium]|nr:xanthine dehydrogenase family protein molybdopterin-binding subunit [Alphaproteobacteria bacterium]
MVRSPHAHARIRGVDVSAARSMPGVHAVLTGADYAAEGIADIGHTANPAGAVDWQNPAFVNRDGTTPFDVPQPTIVRDKVRHAGEIVAVAVGETEAIARQAAERVEM